MASNQSNNPQHGGQPSKPSPPRRVERDERTIELTDDEIKSFGSRGGSEVRAGSKGANKPDSTSK